MTEHAISRDGTRIVYDRLGQGPSVILVGGMFCHRPATRQLAERLAQHATVLNYDRRGRGDSTNTPPYAVEREVDDLDALMTAAGGAAAMYGHSSGAGLALEAAARGLPIERLVLHEPPYGPGDDQSRRQARELAERVQDAVTHQRWVDAIHHFFTATGMPAEMVQAMSNDPALQAVAATMPHDFAVMGNTSRGGTIPEDRVRAVAVPTLVLSGSASPDFFRDTAEQITKLLAHGTHTVLDGHDHAAPAAAVAPVVADFLTQPRRSGEP